MTALNYTLQQKLGPLEVLSEQQKWLAAPGDPTAYSQQVVFVNGKQVHQNPQQAIDDYISAGQVGKTNRTDGTSVYEWTSPDRSSRRSAPTMEAAIAQRNAEYGGDFDKMVADFKAGTNTDNNISPSTQQQILSQFKGGEQVSFGGQVAQPLSGKALTQQQTTATRYGLNLADTYGANQAGTSPAPQSTSQPLNSLGQSIKSQLDSGKGTNGYSLQGPQIENLKSQFKSATGQDYVGSQTSNTQNPAGQPSAPGGTTGPGGVPTAQSSAQELANYVKTNGLTDVQNLPWWRDNPNKQQAWQLIQPAQNTQQNPTTQNPTQQSTTTGTAKNGASDQSTTAASPGTTSVDQNAENIKEAYAMIDASNLDPTTKALYKQTIGIYIQNHQGEIADAQKIIDTFNQVKNDTIDPEYRQAVAQQIDITKRSIDSLTQQRQIELDQQNTATKANITNNQQDLANRGMLFSGEAVKTLGTDSPFAQTGSTQANQSAIPTVDFGGLPLGTAQQANQAATSSSALRYQDSITNLQRQAEANLGSVGSAGLVPGVAQLGGVIGTLEKGQQSDYLNELNNISNNMQNNVAAKKPIDAFAPAA